MVPSHPLSSLFLCLFRSQAGSGTLSLPLITKGLSRPHRVVVVALSSAKHSCPLVPSSSAIPPPPLSPVLLHGMMLSPAVAPPPPHTHQVAVWVRTRQRHGEREREVLRCCRSRQCALYYSVPLPCPFSYVPFRAFVVAYYSVLRREGNERLCKLVRPHTSKELSVVP